MFATREVKKPTKGLALSSKDQTSRDRVEGTGQSDNLHGSTHFLQRYLGNNYMQTKLKMGTRGDRYEKEADNIMQKFLSTPGKCLFKASNITVSSPNVASADPINEGGNVSPDIVKRIESQRTGGHPIEDRTRRELESFFGYNFHSVRIHNDNESQRTAGEIGARAFTVKNDIWLGSGESLADVGLIAHELTHVVQQGAANRLNRKATVAVGFDNDLGSERFQMWGPRLSRNQVGDYIQRDGGLHVTLFFVDCDYEVGSYYSACGDVYTAGPFCSAGSAIDWRDEYCEGGTTWSALNTDEGICNDDCLIKRHGAWERA